MAFLFLKGRRWFELGSEDYGNVLLLQVRDIDCDLFSC